MLWSTLESRVMRYGCCSLVPRPRILGMRLLAVVPFTQCVMLAPPQYRSVVLKLFQKHRCLRRRQLLDGIGEEHPDNKTLNSVLRVRKMLRLFFLVAFQCDDSPMCPRWAWERG